MKIRPAILALLLLSAISRAQSNTTEPSATVDLHQAQIQAATANGIANLRQQVLAAKLSRDTTVADFVSRTKSFDDLSTVLNSAQPAGGPRWIEDYLCQVRVELPATKVLAFLTSVAKDDPKRAGIKPDALRSSLGGWKDLTFSAVGSSAGGEKIEQVQPHDSTGKWSQVSDLSRKRAIYDARIDAMQQVVKSIGPVMLDDKKHISDALVQPVISQRFDNWLGHLPVTKIEFQDDLKVSVTLAIPPKSISNALKSAVQSDVTFNRGLNIDWSKFNTEISKVPVSFSGTASAVVEPPSTLLPIVTLPVAPQEGIDQLDAEGNAVPGASKLKVSLAAEADAESNIREKFLTLHLDSKTTLADAAKKDPSLNPAIDLAIKHARTSKVIYKADGSVCVQISLDVRDAWDELRFNR